MSFIHAVSECVMNSQWVCQIIDVKQLCRCIVVSCKVSCGCCREMWLLPPSPLLSYPNTRTTACISICHQINFSSCSTVCWSHTALQRSSTVIRNSGISSGKPVWWFR